MWVGSSSLECFKEYDWTEFCSVVVKKKFFDSLAYFKSLTWPWVVLVELCKTCQKSPTSDPFNR